MKTLIVVPDGRLADALRGYYGTSPDVVIRPIISLTGHRADRVFVFPLHDGASDRERETFERCLRESVACRVAFGGELVIL